MTLALSTPPRPAPTPHRGTVRPPARAPRERLLSLDVFRGVTVAGMLLVNNPGSWEHIYPPLEHATWNGWTPTDLVFPFFLFIVGITTYLSLSVRRERGDDEHAIRMQIVRRGALIFLFGLLINGFPYFTFGDVAGVADPTLLQRIADRLLHWRIMGVLQRIGAAYLVAGLLTQRTTLRQQVTIVATLLLGYWVVMTVLPVPGEGTIGALLLGDPTRTMAAWTDRLVLDWTRLGLGNHLWASSLTWDPEGILSTVPAVGTCMIGNMAGRWIAQPRPLADRLAGLFAAGALGMMAGSIWNWVFPINKSLWTSSYVVFCAGIAAVGLATVMWVVDYQQVRGWTRFFVVYGLNPTIAFVGSGVMARCIYSIFHVTLGGTRMPFQAGVYQTLFASWLDPINASLAFAVTFVLFWYGVLSVLYRKGIVLKV